MVTAWRARRNLKLIVLHEDTEQNINTKFSDEDGQNMSSSSSQPLIEIGGHSVGEGQPPYIIAEMSANHCRDLGIAREIITRCAEAGVNAIKVQTYRADTLSIDTRHPNHVIPNGPWQGRRLFDLYAEAEMPWEWTPILMTDAEDLGMDFFSTPFEPSAVDFLENLGVPAFKVASFDIVNFPLLERLAQSGRPIIMSTGMSNWSEVTEAVDLLRSHGTRDIALLKCTSSYPAEAWELNLKGISQLSQRFATPVGFSDHTTSSTAALVALGQGACIFEKHVKLSESSAGVDSFFSSTTTELQEYVQVLQQGFKMLGDGELSPSQSELESLALRPSVMAIRDIRRGEIFCEDNLTVRRPSQGAHPREFKSLLGTKAELDIACGQGVFRQSPDDPAS